MTFDSQRNLRISKKAADISCDTSFDLDKLERPGPSTRLDFGVLTDWNNGIPCNDAQTAKWTQVCLYATGFECRSRVVVLVVLGIQSRRNPCIL